MRQTSLQAYREIRKELGKRQNLVYNGFKAFGDSTNLEMSKKLHIPINQITPRTNELVKKKLVEAKFHRKCNVSGRMAIVWGLR